MLENGILVSVIIPVYNTAPYLEEALDSVLHQTYDNLEIIIVDDGSTDGSGEICEQYAKRDKRILLIHQENKGLSSARNAALDRMTGAIVAFLDSDDAYQPDYMREMLSAMMREEADVVVCQYTIQNTAGRLDCSQRGQRLPIIKVGSYARDDALRALADSQLDVIVWNKLYRRYLWEHVRFPEGYVYEDIDTAFRILDLCGTVYILGKPLYTKRELAQSITGRCTEENIRNRMLADKHFDAYIREHTPGIFSEEHMRRLQQSRHSIMLGLYYRFCRDARNRRSPFCEEIRKDILTRAKEYGVQGVRNKAACFLLRYCPKLLLTAFSVYLFFRVSVKKLTER